MRSGIDAPSRSWINTHHWSPSDLTENSEKDSVPLYSLRSWQWRHRRTCCIWLSYASVNVTCRPYPSFQRTFRHCNRAIWTSKQLECSRENDRFGTTSAWYMLLLCYPETWIVPVMLGRNLNLMYRNICWEAWCRCTRLFRSQSHPVRYTCVRKWQVKCLCRTR